MKKVVTFGEVLLRLSTPDKKTFRQVNNFELFYAGSEANVAIGLGCLGSNVDFVTTLADHQLSSNFIPILKSANVGTSKINFGNGRLGLFYVEQGAGLRQSRVIYDRTHSSFSEAESESYDWKAILKDANWFHISGISPAVSRKAADASLTAVKAAKESGCIVSLDLNYRKNLWSYASPESVMPEIVKYTDVLLGDPGTCNVMLGTKLQLGKKYNSAQDAEPAFEELHNKFPNLKTMAMVLRNVVSNEHHEIGALLYEGNKMYGADYIPVNPVIERIGSGDAFMAGMIFGKQENWDPQEILNFARALCILKMTVSGDYGYFSEKEVKNAMNSGFDSKISR